MALNPVGGREMISGGCNPTTDLEKKVNDAVELNTWTLFEISDQDKQVRKLGINKVTTDILPIIEEEKRKMTETLKWCDDASCGKNIQIAELEAHLKKTQLDGLKMIDKIAGLEGDVKDLRDAVVACINAGNTRRVRSRSVGLIIQHELTAPLFLLSEE